MASVVQGYEYDIFISYRQKDNKYDGWVTEFVTNLKTELEATLKEEISVYFDINPHDGLLETHEVDASLKEKLKCLIFIPIISQTYCDPKSFAWQNEFCAFNKFAKEDQLGKSIRLSGGNVAGRILPVKIHELDSEDIALIENELEGSLRGIEFIYKSAGVNRPLRANEVLPLENLNKTYYRNQINKTANAIKEILNALKKPQTPFTGSPKEIIKQKRESLINLKSKIIAASLLTLGVILLGYFLIPKLIAPDNQLEKSIAVLPFENDSPDQQNGYFIVAVMDEILNNLQKIQDLTVLTRTSTEQFAGANKPSIREIAKKLKVNYLVEGSGQKYGNTFRLNVKLISVRNEKYIWVETFEQEIQESKDILRIQNQVAQAIASKLKVTISPEEKRLIEKTYDINLTAYDFYQRGQAELDKYSWPEFNFQALKKAEALFHKSLQNDSTFANAYFGLAQILWIKSDPSRNNNILESAARKEYLDSMMVLANIALRYDNHLEGAYIIRGAYFAYYGDLNKSLEEHDKVLRINPNSSIAFTWKGKIYEDIDILKSLEYYQKGASLDPGPGLSYVLKTIGDEYFEAGFPDIGRDFYIKALNLDGDSIGYSDIMMRHSAGMAGDFKKLVEYFEKRRLTDSSNKFLLLDLGYCNTYSGNFKESLKYFKQYLSIVKPGELNNPKIEPYIGYSYLQNGYRKEAEYFFNSQMESYKKINQTGYSEARYFWNYRLACIYACKGDKVKAYENLKLFLKSPFIAAIWINRLKYDPMLNTIRNEPEFQKIFMEAEAKHQVLHERVKKWLEEQDENSL